MKNAFPLPFRLDIDDGVHGRHPFIPVVVVAVEAPVVKVLEEITDVGDHPE